MASSLAAWPLLSQLLSEVKSADDLVRWGLDAWGCRRVVGLRELRVAALLLASSQDLRASSASTDWTGFLEARFDEKLPCVHLFGPHPRYMLVTRVHASSSLLDLALRFGHAEVARCLQARGLEQQALRPEDLQRLPVSSLAKLPLSVLMQIGGEDAEQGEVWIGEWEWDQERSEWHRECWCRPRNGDWQQVCILGGDQALHPWQQRLGDSTAADAQGHWASDWKAPTPWARALVDVPATRAVLALAAEGLFPDLDEDAKPRLLDAALLLGEPEAAAALAGSCGPRHPLRIWACISEWPRRHSFDLAAEYAEAHLRAGLRDVWRLGFRSAVDVAKLAVEASAPGLARAVAELLPEGMWEMELTCGWITERGSHGNAVLREGALAALEALGPPPQGCSVCVVARRTATQEPLGFQAPLLFLPALLGDQPAATRLVHAGFTLQAEAGSGGSSISRVAGHLGDPALESLIGVHDDGKEVLISLKPVASRLEVAERTLRLLFAAAASRSLCAVAATGRRGLLGRPGLLEHVALFAAVWTDGEEVVRQELTAMIGRDPLRGLSLRTGQRGAPAPVTAATAQASPAVPPGHPSSEQVVQQAAGGRSAEPQGYSASYPVGEPHSELQAARSSEGPAQEPEGAEGRGSAELQVRSTAEPEAEAHVEQQAASSSAGPRPMQGGEGSEGQADKDLALEAAEFCQAVQASESDAVQVEQENLHRVLLLSKEEAHGGQEAFNGEVYALLRLNKHSPETLRVLLESEELRPCREHVAAAGCELQPAWAGGALLCVPMTQELYQELDLELRRHHVLLLKSDVSRLEAALRALPYRKRPLVKPDHRAKPYSAAKDGAPEEAELPSGRAVAATAEDRAATEAGRQSSAAVATTAEGRSAGEARQPSCTAAAAEAEGFAPNEAGQSGGAAVAAMAEEGLAFKRARLLSSTTAAATTEDPAATGSVQPCGAAAAATAEEGAASDEARQPSGMAAAATAREPAPATGEQPSGAAAAAEEADEAFHAEHNAHVVDRDALFRSWGITVEELGTFLTIKVDGSSAAASSDVTGSAPAAVHRESPGTPQHSGQLASHAPLHARNPRRYRRH